jgi:hypothetical protein
MVKHGQTMQRMEDESEALPCFAIAPMQLRRSLWRNTADPNREDAPQSIVRLVRQVIRVSLDTVQIVNGLPAEFEPKSPPK